MESLDLLDSHKLPKIMEGHAAALIDHLADGENVRHLSLARLDAFTGSLARSAFSPQRVNPFQELNELKGGLLAVTDLRVVYLGQTLVGQGRFKKGNELIALPLAGVETVRSKRGRGSGGDIRKVFTLIASGSKLWVTADGIDHLFVEIKPLGAAAEMERAIAADTGA